jgi:hypothetical protein
MKSKVGLAAAKAASLRINLNVEGCGIECVMGKLVHTGLGSSLMSKFSEGNTREHHQNTGRRYPATMTCMKTKDFSWKSQN